VSSRLTVFDDYRDPKKMGTMLPPGTYFVLRSDDRFAAPALWQYAAVLQTALELDGLSDAERDQVAELRDRVEALAKQWQAVRGKVSD
jgi:hypothetical protein